MNEARGAALPRLPATVAGLLHYSPSMLVRLLPLLLAVPAFAGQGGPDSFGYTWIDSNSGYPVPIEYDPPSSSDVEVGSDSYGTVPIGFAFPFYGQTYTTVEAQADGGLTFGDPSFDLPYNNQCLPLGGTPPMILPWWDDLEPWGGGWFDDADMQYSTYGTAPNRVFVLQYEGADHYSVSGEVTFEVHLHEDGVIEMLYLDTNLSGSSYDDGNSATIGMQDANGAAWLQIDCNDDVLQENYVIAFLPPACE